MTKFNNPRGLLAKEILECDIIAVQSQTDTAADAAKMLGVSYKTYKKYARKYNRHKVAPAKKKSGYSRKIGLSSGKFPLEDIFSGKYPKFPTYMLLRKLFTAHVKPRSCENCGFCTCKPNNEGPFVLDYIDDNPLNKSLDNLRVLCLNCAYLLKGYISKGGVNSKMDLQLHKIQRDSTKYVPENVEPESELDLIESRFDNIDISSMSEEEINQLLQNG